MASRACGCAPGLGHTQNLQVSSDTHESMGHVYFWTLWEKNGEEGKTVVFQKMKMLLLKKTDTLRMTSNVTIQKCFLLKRSTRVCKFNSSNLLYFKWLEIVQGDNSYQNGIFSKILMSILGFSFPYLLDRRDGASLNTKAERLKVNETKGQTYRGLIINLI